MTKPTPKSRKSKTRQKIVNTASQLFLSQGYARTTTQEIALQAGVAEVTLFRHFGNKQKLFQAVVEQSGPTRMFSEIEGQLTFEYHSDLLRIAQFILPILIAEHKAIKLMLSEAAHFPEIEATVTQSARDLHQLLNSYFERQIELGNVQPFPAHIMTQAFASMLFGFALGQDTYVMSFGSDDPLDVKIEYFISIFLKGTAKEE